MDKTGGIVEIPKHNVECSRKLEIKTNHKNIDYGSLIETLPWNAHFTSLKLDHGSVARKSKLWMWADIVFIFFEYLSPSTYNLKNKSQ